MLESLEQSNIKRMSVEEPEQKSVVFDPDRDLTQDDFAALRQDIFERTTESSLPIYWQQAYTLLIFPEEKIVLSNRDTDMDILNNTALEANDEEDFSVYLGYVAAGKIIFGEVDPETFSMDEDWEQGIAMLKLWKGQSKWEEFLPLASDMKILNPEGELPLDESTFQTLREYISRQVFFSKSFEQLARLKIIFPEKKIEVLPRLWEGGQEVLAEARRDGLWEDFASLASDMKILAAEKITITETGIEFEMPKGKNSLADQSIPPRPEERNF